MYTLSSTFLLLSTTLLNFGESFTYHCGRERNNSFPPIEKLQQDILCDYDSFSKPVKNPSTRILVDLMYIPVFLDVNKDEETIQISGYIQLNWTDENIHWKPTKYSKITEFKAEYYDIWFPKITSYDRSSSWYKFLDEMDKYRFEDVLIRYNGSITARISSTLNGPCSVDYSKWPYEEWQCKFIITSRGDDTNNVIVNFDPKSNIIMSNFMTSRIWKVISVPSFQEYPESDNVELSVKLQRHSSHFEIAFIFPGIVLVFLTGLSFWLTNKIYCRMMINMLTTWVQITFLQSLFDILEHNGSQGVKIYSFYLDSMFISFIGVLCAVLSAKLLTKTDDPPSWLIELIGSFAVVPYCGPLFSFLMNDDINSSAKFEEEEAALVHTANNKSSQKWRIVANCVDKLAFFASSLYLLFFYVL